MNENSNLICQLKKPLEIEEGGVAAVQINNCDFSRKKGEKVSLKLTIKYYKGTSDSVNLATGIIVTTIQ